MATVIPNFTTGQKTFVGLGTYAYTINTSAMHVCKIRISKHATSNLTCTISQSGSQSATLGSVTVQPVATTTGESSVELHATGNFVSGDVVTFTLTSSAVVDQQLNNVKSDILVKIGSGN